MQMKFLVICFVEIENKKIFFFAKEAKKIP